MEMRFQLAIPDHAWRRLRAAAEEAHRTPRMQAEWILISALSGGDDPNASQDGPEEKR